MNNSEPYIRENFIRKCIEIAAGRQLIFKLHPTEKAKRVKNEIRKIAPQALIFTEGNGSGSYLLPSTRSALAADLGVTPAALYRSLTALQTGGIISLSDSTIHWHQSKGPASINLKLIKM